MLVSEGWVGGGSILCREEEGTVVEDVVDGIDGDYQRDHEEGERQAGGEEGDNLPSRPSFVELHGEIWRIGSKLVEDFGGCEQLLDWQSAADSCMGTIASSPSCAGMRLRTGPEV
jgi:hypothetical protein